MLGGAWQALESDVRSSPSAPPSDHLLPLWRAGLGVLANVLNAFRNLSALNGLLINGKCDREQKNESKWNGAIS